MPTKKRKNNGSRRRRRVTKSIRRKMTGGNYTGSSPYTSYDQNLYNNDPSRLPGGNISARNIVGGSRRKYKGSRKKGGSIFNAMTIGSGSPAWQNPTFSFSMDPWSSASLFKGYGINGTSSVSDNNNHVRGMV